MFEHRGWRKFLRPKVGANYLRLLSFSAVLAVGVGYGVHQSSLSAFTTSRSEETVTALQLTDAFVSTYSNERAKFNAADAPVPATFRAHAIELFNSARQRDEVPAAAFLRNSLLW